MSTRSAEIRAKLDHPIVDGDGHVVEHLGVFKSFLGEQGGGYLAEFERVMRDDPPVGRGLGEWREPKGGWWAFTTRTLDRATVTVPGLMRERLPELGIDFAIVYPTLGLALPTFRDAELRQALCRAVNTMHAELFAPHLDRLAPVAVIPMHTPAEAIEELSHAVDVLGFKAAMISPGVARPIPAIEQLAPEAFPAASYLDSYGIDSPYDYDPVWQAFQDRRVAVTIHGASSLRFLPSGRRSPSNYVYNHVGGHAYQQQEVCRSLFLGGVPRRFADLSFAFLEGGVSWAVQMLGDLIEHWEKRSYPAILQFDPAKIDQDEMRRLLIQHGGDRFEKVVMEEWQASKADVEPEDDFAAAGISGPEDIARVFAERFFFGCEADDGGVRTGFSTDTNPFGVRLRAMFSSDIGHWDVPDITRVVEESYEMVEEGVLDEEDYRRFMMEHPVEVHRKANPSFFEGTALASALPSAVAG